MKEPMFINKLFKREKIKISSIIVFSFCILAIILVFAYIKSPKKIAKDNLENVLKIVLIFPDRRLDVAYNLSVGKTISDSTSEDLTNIGEGVTEVITPYFTEKGLNVFINQKYAYGAFCAGTYWKTEVKSIRSYSDKDAARMLLFTAIIICKKPRGELELILKGEAQYNKAGKLSYLKLADSTVFLLNSLNRAFQNEAGLYDK